MAMLRAVMASPMARCAWCAAGAGRQWAGMGARAGLNRGMRSAHAHARGDAGRPAGALARLHGARRASLAPYRAAHLAALPTTPRHGRRGTRAAMALTSWFSAIPSSASMCAGCPPRAGARRRPHRRPSKTFEIGLEPRHGTPGALLERRDGAATHTSPIPCPHPTPGSSLLPCPACSPATRSFLAATRSSSPPLFFRVRGHERESKDF